MKIIESNSDLHVFTSSEMKELKTKFRKVDFVLIDKDGLYSIQKDEIQLSDFGETLIKISKYIEDNFSLYSYAFLKNNKILFGFKKIKE